MYRRLFVLLALGLITLGLAIILRPQATSLFWRIAAPISHSLTAAALWIRSGAKTLRSIREILAENASLREELAKTRSEIAALVQVEEENAALRRELAVEGTRPAVRLLTARLLAGSPQGFLAQAVIDRGRREGLGGGETVVAGGVLVGRVSEVSETAAKVILLGDEGLVVPGRTLSTKISGLVRANLRDGLLLTDVPRDAAPEVGELVVTSGADWPASLLLGKVAEVERRPTELFAHVRLAPLQSRERLGHVFVILR